ncbi:metal-dependent hydrolase [Flagellimonas allohymeniacidonis]|uniref:Metal-dependent hydrolase n=1 Tax=Flagellimonas allohymeniacidonis TaxID=2517819 RepID=A0A4Q8QG08_9FLAO|nr:metal-dependent hydrolase [Allomuricauda hymeniacidonis]TAI48824.1 metal-dependent hydrolase [Allomuricauda hymeniacidonis]
MDSLTQIVLGAAVGEATLGKKVGNKALLYGAIAGTIPDLDVIANFLTDTITAIELHRGFSHSIVFGVLLAPILGWLVNKLERKHNLGWKPWAKLFFLGLFTHPLLDAFTTWGTQLFWPFKVRLAFNSIFVIDPLYTLPFLLLTLVLLFYKRDSKMRRRLNIAGLGISTGYLILTLVIKEVVNQKFEQALNDQQIAYSNISTRPAPLTTLLWNANIETADSYLIADYSLFDTAPIRFETYPKNRKESTIMMKFPNVQRLMTITEGWFIIEQKMDQWYFYDLRFGLVPRKDQPPFFAFTYLLEEINGRIRATETPKTERDANYLLSQIWERIKGRP